MPRERLRISGPTLAPLLLLLGVGLGLWLFSLLPSRPDSPAAPAAPAASYYYQWLTEADRPAAIYRLPVQDPALTPDQNWGEGGPPALAIFTFQPIAVNRADIQTLAFLPGIGPALAARIVEYRTAHGPFQDREELLRVRGIGPKTLAAIRTGITID